MLIFDLRLAEYATSSVLFGPVLTVKYAWNRGVRVALMIKWLALFFHFGVERWAVFVVNNLLLLFSFLRGSKEAP